MTRAERRVFELLSDGGWHRESELRTTFRLLQWLVTGGCEARLARSFPRLSRQVPREAA